MDKNEIRLWRLRMEGNPSSSTTDAPKTSRAADTGFASSAELDDLFELTVMTANENNWEPPTREEFEARYRKEIAQRYNREIGDG